jgi:membrane protease YdiL (CAAX protease family)
MNLAFLSPSWLNVTRLGVVILTALLGWITYRSHLLLKEYRPDVNLLLSIPEIIVRLLLVAVCLGLAWLSGLPSAELGLVFRNPLQTLAAGLGIGLVLVVVLNLVTNWCISRFGRHIYSPLVIQNVLPRRPVEWVLAVFALLPAVLMEELLFRSLWLGSFNQMMPWWLLTIGTSIIFGLMHQPQGQLGMILAGGINIFFCILFVWSGQLLLPLTAHYIANLFQLIVAYHQRDWLENY